MKRNLLNLTRAEILNLDPKDFSKIEIAGDIIISWAKKLGCYWKFDGTPENPGVHAILKSGLHSNEFFNVKEMLEYENVRRIIAQQLGACIGRKDICIAGIPHGGKKLGEEIASIYGLQYVDFEKKDEKIIPSSEILDKSFKIIFVDDVATKGTALLEAYECIYYNDRLFIEVITKLLVPLNRSKSDSFHFPGYDKTFQIKALANVQPEEWDSNSNDGCPLCKMGSTPRKPKISPEVWKKHFQQG